MVSLWCIMTWMMASLLQWKMSVLLLHIKTLINDSDACVIWPWTPTMPCMLDSTISLLEQTLSLSSQCETTLCCMKDYHRQSLPFILRLLTVTICCVFRCIRRTVLHMMDRDANTTFQQDTSSEEKRRLFNTTRPEFSVWGDTSMWMLTSWLSSGNVWTTKSQ